VNRQRVLKDNNHEVVHAEDLASWTDTIKQLINQILAVCASKSPHIFLCEGMKQPHCNIFVMESQNQNGWSFSILQRNLGFLL